MTACTPYLNLSPIKIGNTQTQWLYGYAFHRLGHNITQIHILLSLACEVHCTVIGYSPQEGGILTKRHKYLPYLDTSSDTNGNSPTWGPCTCTYLQENRSTSPSHHPLCASVLQVGDLTGKTLLWSPTPWWSLLLEEILPFPHSVVIGWRLYGGARPFYIHRCLYTPSWAETDALMASVYICRETRRSASVYSCCWYYYSELPPGRTQPGRGDARAAATVAILSLSSDSPPAGSPPADHLLPSCSATAQQLLAFRQCLCYC